MKRIIAAALSVLVGAFGYTLVDQSIDDRVTKLESEVVELRSEVSAYHSNNFTEVFPTTEIDLAVGTKLIESSLSLHKFLIREYSNGSFVFIHPNSYTSLSNVSRLRSASFDVKETTTRKMTTTRKTTTTDPIAPEDPRETTTRKTTTTRGNTTTRIETTERKETTTYRETTTKSKTTTERFPTRELFIYLTDITAAVSSVDKSTSLEYSYDNDYSLVSKPVQFSKTRVTITYKGYTDASLCGKNLFFSPEFSSGNPSTTTISNNVVKQDGSFEFSATYSIDCLYDNYYAITSVRVR